MTIESAIVTQMVGESEYEQRRIIREQAAKIATLSLQVEKYKRLLDRRNSRKQNNTVKIAEFETRAGRAEKAGVK